MATNNNPAPTKLDFNQIFQRSFDEDQDRIRVEAEVTATLGTVECVITAQSGDSIILADRNANYLSSGSYNGNQALHVQSPDNPSTVTLLNSSSSLVQISLAGLNSVGFQLNPGTLVATLQAQASVDGGQQWTPVPFYDPVNSAILTSLSFNGNSTTKIVSLIPIGGSSDVRVVVSSYTSGSASALLRAANVSGASGAITAAAFGVVTNNIISIPNNTPVLVLAKNVNRKYAYFGNSSNSTVRLQFANSANLSNSTGIPVQSQVGFYELKGDNLFTGDVYAFSSSDVEISVTEGTP